MPRQAGFIKTYNSTQRMPALQQEPSEFSYFRMRPQPDDEEFSPYKFEQQQEPELGQILSKTRKSPSRPPLPQRQLQKAQTVSNLADRVKADHLHSRLQQKVAAHNNPQPKKNAVLQENIGNIRNKIEQLDEVLRELKTRKGPECQQRARSYEKMQKKFEEDSWSETSSDCQQEIKVAAIPQQNIQRSDSEDEQQIDYERKGTVAKGYQHEYELEQQDEKIEDQGQFSGKFSSANIQRPLPTRETNVITFNSRLKDHPPLQIKPYSSSQSESPSQSQHQQHLPERNFPTNPKNNSQFHKNRGGVCFEVDVKQFKAPLPKEQKPVPQRKKKPVDKKADILRRREAAKAYDKMARRAVFSPYY